MNPSNSSLLPLAVRLAAIVLFLAVAAVHTHHLRNSAGQRRPWHACHVLMALAMAAMVAPPSISSEIRSPALWQPVILCAGVLACGWALRDRDRVNLVWLLTALDLGAMLAMYTVHHPGAALSAAVVAYLVADAALWAWDGYRGLEARPTLMLWLAPDPTPVAATSSTGLLGDVDIAPSMIVMLLGMAYMTLAMHVS